MTKTLDVHVLKKLLSKASSLRFFSKRVNVLVQLSVLTGLIHLKWLLDISSVIIESENYYEIVQDETFVKNKYLINSSEIQVDMIYDGVKFLINLNLMTTNLREAEKFLSAGSDWNNVNIGTILK